MPKRNDFKARHNPQGDTILEEVHPALDRIAHCTFLGGCDREGRIRGCTVVCIGIDRGEPLWPRSSVHGNVLFD